MENTIVKVLSRFYQDGYGRHTMNPQIKETVYKIIHCRTMELGGHLYGCPDHHSFSIVYNSCKQRGCPICTWQRKLQWLNKKLEILLPIEHYHIVYKLPSQLAILWLMNKREVASALFGAVGEIYETLCRNEGITRGIINVLHTTGRNLSYHPHIHSLVSIEGISADKEWKRKYLNKRELEAVYRTSIKKKLIKGLKSGEIKAQGRAEEYIKLIKKIADWEWDIFQSEIYTNGEGVARYCANHIRGMAVEEKDIKQITDDCVEIEHGYEGRKENIRLTPEEFVIRYINHIPPKGLVLVRNLGLYSNRRVKETMEMKKAIEQRMGIEAPKNVYEGKKKKCPVCGKELILIDFYKSYELRVIIKKYLIDGSPPEHGKIYEISKTAA